MVPEKKKIKYRTTVLKGDITENEVIIAVEYELKKFNKGLLFLCGLLFVGFICILIDKLFPPLQTELIFKSARFSISWIGGLGGSIIVVSMIGFIILFCFSSVIVKRKK